MSADTYLLSTLIPALLWISCYQVQCSLDSILATTYDLHGLPEKEIVEGKDGSNLWNTLYHKGQRYYLREMDMIISEEVLYNWYTEDRSARQKRGAEIRDTMLWTSNTVPYRIDPNFSAEQRVLILESIEHWTLATCIRFVPVPDNNYTVLVFQYIPHDPERKISCSSFVGMVQGPQHITLTDRCVKRGVLLHEIGHALGLYHEHTRSIRNHFVTIKPENILPGFENQFDKLKDNNTFKKPYDHHSIMHYGKFYFSVTKTPGNETILPKNKTYTDVIGNMDRISFFDAKVVNQMYNCAAHCPQKLCPEEGFLGRDCECWCNGTRLEPVTRCWKAAPCSDPKIDQSKYMVLGRYCHYFPINFDLTFPNGTILCVKVPDGCGNSSTLYTCLHGVWHGSLPTCEPEPCNVEDYWFVSYNLYNITEQEMINGLVPHGSEISLSCIDRPNIKSVLSCHFGRWDETPENCTEELGECFMTDLNLVDFSYYISETDSQLNRNDSVPTGEVLTAQCRYTYEETNVTCKDGQWLKQLSSCQPRKMCSLIPDATMNGDIYSGYTITCQPGFTMTRADFTNFFRCTWEGKWKPWVPECVISDGCVLSPAHMQQGVTYMDTAGNELSEYAPISDGHQVWLKCPPGKRAVPHEVTCRQRAWVTVDGKLLKFPKCEKKTN